LVLFLLPPYDDWEIEVMDFEFKTVDNDIYTTKTNKYGNLIAVDKRNKFHKIRRK